HQITTNSFSEEKLKDKRIWAVIDKIKGVASQEFEAMFPAKQPSKVVVKTTDGKEYSEYLEYPKGDPREPMTMDDLTAKFNALSDGLLSPERQAEVKEMIFACEEMNVRNLMAKLVV
ncbi:MAG: MmgE/PrpD family protein, partial [candidate division Zixibacteria bacterium]|nr:MmgE/PrpD family protein [candidate division Zixibacteria bacterium]